MLLNFETFGRIDSSSAFASLDVFSPSVFISVFSLELSSLELSFELLLVFLIDEFLVKLNNLSTKIAYLVLLISEMKLLCIHSKSQIYFLSKTRRRLLWCYWSSTMALQFVDLMLLWSECMLDLWYVSTYGIPISLCCPRRHRKWCTLVQDLFQSLALCTHDSCWV